MNNPNTPAPCLECRCLCCHEQIPLGAMLCSWCAAEHETQDSEPEIAGENDGNESYTPTATDLEEFAAWRASLDPETEEEADWPFEDLGGEALSPLGRQLALSCIVAGVPCEQVAAIGPAVRAYLEGVAA